MVRLCVPVLASLAAISACSGQLVGGGGAGGDDDDVESPLDAGTEQQPEPSTEPGLSDPPSSSLHNRGCGGVDWQLIHGWLLLPHEAPEVAPSDQMARCVERYAGWVSNQADAAGVSRRSVYGALAATGQCDAERDYDGALVPGSLCVLVNPDLGEEECLEQMAASRGFGITTLARILGSDQAARVHKRDAPAMAAYLATGSVGCGGDDRWRLAAPDGYIDRYIAAYNGIKALSSDPPACRKTLVMSVALYTGMDEPGVDGVATANGCWTYERVSKTNSEWKLCNYDGTVIHPDGTKWVYDDTNTAHDSATDQSRILACKSGVPGRGYVDMANRGSGWRKSVTSGVRVHFAEIYSSQFQVDDQFSLWKSSGEPGEPMINLGEPTTGATRIHDAALRACGEVQDGGFLGIYVYPESLRDQRMSALVSALNECTRD